MIQRRRLCYYAALLAFAAISIACAGMLRVLARPDVQSALVDVVIAALPGETTVPLDAATSHAESTRPHR